MIDGKRLLFSLTIVSYALTLVSGIVYLFNNNNVSLLSTLLFLLVSSLIACWNDIKYYLIHFIFFLTIFVFLVSRPTIDYFRDGALDTYHPIAYRFAFIVVMVSILGLTTGGLLARYFIARKKIQVSKIESSLKEVYIKRLRFVSLGVFLLTYPSILFAYLNDSCIACRLPTIPTMQTLKVNCLILPISYQHLRSMQCVCIWQPSQRNGRQQ